MVGFNGACPDCCCNGEMKKKLKYLKRWESCPDRQPSANSQPPPISARSISAPIHFVTPHTDEFFDETPTPPPASTPPPPPAGTNTALLDLVHDIEMEKTSTTTAMDPIPPATPVRPPSHGSSSRPMPFRAEKGESGRDGNRKKDGEEKRRVSRAGGSHEEEEEKEEVRFYFTCQCGTVQHLVYRKRR